MRFLKRNKTMWIVISAIALLIIIGGIFAISSSKNAAKLHAKKERILIKQNKSTKNESKDSDNKQQVIKPATNSMTHNGVIPINFRGDWYSKDSKMTIMPDEIVMPDSGQPEITSNSVPLRLYVHASDNGTYYLYRNPNPNADGAEGGDGTLYWLANFTINNKLQKVLVSYTRMGYFVVKTMKPTSSDYSFTYDGDAAREIGNPNLDEVKNKAENMNTQN